MRVKFISLIVVVLFLLSAVPSAVFADSTYTVYLADPEYDSIDSGCYTKVKSYSSFDSAYEAMQEHKSDYAVVRDSTGKVVAMKEGMIITCETNSSIFIFTSLFGNGYNPYTSLNQVGYYVENKSATSVVIKISGFVGTADVDDVILIPSAFCYPYNKVNARYEFDYYTKNSSGDLVHYISTYSSSNGGVTGFSGIIIDKAPEFMEQGVRYYSTDGYVYYLDPVDAVRMRNEVGRHCIYYRDLSYRSVTSYTASELESYICSVTSECVYEDYMYAFVAAQDTYGVNAAMELAFANHESAYGESGYAAKHYNFFGVGAVDSNPDSASEYADPEDGILQHAKYYMNRYFFDAYAYIDLTKGTSYYDVADKPAGYIANYSGDSRYFGTNPGNKNVGINVRYASDPFHGEKVARHMYAIDKYLGFEDYGKYSIGKTNKITCAYSKADTDSWKLYKYSCKDRNRSGGTLSSDPVGMMVTIVGEKGDFYKVLSDMPVNKDGYACFTWDYDREYSYAYVLKSDIDLIYDGGNLSVKDPALESITVCGQEIAVTDGVYEYFFRSSGGDVSVSADAVSESHEVSIGDYEITSGKFTEIPITVTDGSGGCAEYLLSVYVPVQVTLPDSTFLTSLTPSSGSLSGSFSKEQREYTLITDDIDKDITFAFETESPQARGELIGGEKNGNSRVYTVVVTSFSGENGYYRINVKEE